MESLEKTESKGCEHLIYVYNFREQKKDERTNLKLTIASSRSLVELGIGMIVID